MMHIHRTLNLCLVISALTLFCTAAAAQDVLTSNDGDFQDALTWGDEGPSPRLLTSSFGSETTLGTVTRTVVGFEEHVIVCLPPTEAASVENALENTQQRLAEAEGLLATHALTVSVAALEELAGLSICVADGEPGVTYGVDDVLVREAFRDDGRVVMFYELPAETQFYNPGLRVRHEAGQAIVEVARARFDEEVEITALAVMLDGPKTIVAAFEVGDVPVVLGDVYGGVSPVEVQDLQDGEGQSPNQALYNTERGQFDDLIALGRGIANGVEALVNLGGDIADGLAGAYQQMYEAWLDWAWPMYTEIPEGNTKPYLCIHSNVAIGVNNPDLTAGHAWLTYHNATGRMQASYALWPDAAAKLAVGSSNTQNAPFVSSGIAIRSVVEAFDNGAGSDVRVNFILDRKMGPYTHCEPLEAPQERLLAFNTGKHREWTYTYNCAAFAREIFDNVAQINFDVSEIAGRVPTPRKLGQSIRARQ